ncbi:MAG: thioredoxin family protein [Alphaproteobacteria bacterium]|nr:thioredoxin family protein [Alphaproteobacteria bacterium]
MIALGDPASAATSEWASNPHGAARLITAVEATGSGTRLDVGLQLRLTPGWHTYWRTPGDAGVPPTIDWQGSENLTAATIGWPAPRRLPPLGGLETLGYEDGVVLPIAVTLAHPGAALRLHAEVDYASCKEVCIPYHASLDLALPPGLALPGPEAPLIAAARDRVPGDFGSAGLRLAGAVVTARNNDAVLSVRVASDGTRLRAPDLFVEDLPRGSPGRPDIELSDGGKEATLAIPITGVPAAAIAGTRLRLTLIDGARAAEIEAAPRLGALPPAPGSATRIGIVGLALLGGLVLNLMPCVLPVLSLKLLALTGYAGAERRAARLGLLATAAGVIVCFAVLAGVLIALKSAGAAIGWGIQFQQPWFLAGMALVTTLFAASLWDWVPLALPGGVAGAVGSVRGRGRFTDAFLLGAFATLLAASCSAPFVGTAIGFALARGPFDIALVFGALGLGMAAPFLAVAAAPGLVAWLPRPGRWMAWLRRLLGLALLGTAVWLLSVLATEAGSPTALLAGGMLAVLLAVLAWRHTLPAGRRARGPAGAGAIVVAAIAVLVPALSGQAGPRDLSTARGEAGLWRPFDQAVLQRMVAEEKIVFVDVSAAWCLTCKVNELAVLDRAPVADQLRSTGVVAMRADWTRPDPIVTAYLQSFGRYGVPLNVVYGPGAPEGIALPELLTPGAVMDAFRRAGAAHPQSAVQRTAE